MNLFVDEDHALYVSDCHNDRAMRWIIGAKEGILVAGGRGQGTDLAQLATYPYGVIVDYTGTVYVADCHNHRIMRWSKGAAEGTAVVGGNEQGKRTAQFNAPETLAFDLEGNLYVADRGNNRIQQFYIARN